MNKHSMTQRYRWVIIGILIVAACFVVFLSSKKSPDQESVQWVEVKHSLIEKHVW
ncbi:hypothetical protein [Photorhabdus sp. RW14-46]|uniref:hypothetical protein n=1 Tax=Photorhabdus sp. RW14-46 TaxID=2100168 RepID=UPI001F60DC57|nr:hypothetical protein [Photorhabdus sp. RW14-46]